MPISRPMEANASEIRHSERVVFETDRHIVTGDVSLPPRGYQSRFSDWFNRPDVDFIPLVDVEISPHGGGQVKRRKFALMAKAHVRFAYPLEDTSEPGA